MSRPCTSCTYLFIPHAQSSERAPCHLAAQQAVVCVSMRRQLAQVLSASQPRIRFLYGLATLGHPPPRATKSGPQLSAKGQAVQGMHRDSTCFGHRASPLWAIFSILGFVHCLLDPITLLPWGMPKFLAIMPPKEVSVEASKLQSALRIWTGYHKYCSRHRLRSGRVDRWGHCAQCSSLGQPARPPWRHC